MDTTVIYYTANVEEETFARKVRSVIWKNAGGLPVISVSRKPIDFGENICVGEQPVCVANIWRQIYAGLQAAKTRFAIAVEGDTLYPPEYFTFTPPSEDHFYRYNNIWILYLWPTRRYGGKFWRKSAQMEGAQMCGVEHWMRAIEKGLEVNDWLDTRLPPVICSPTLPEAYTWHSANPVLTCKTEKGLYRYTTRSIVSADSVPCWGTVENVMKNLANKEEAWIHFPTS